MKEMVGGCCVCSDEGGWPDNPLVYCDGDGCTVAVHQACYGIVTVPTGPWFCRKCESPDKQTKVRCELCPSRSGALKRSDNGGWAHVVCALYIPEVRFGNVTSMEPIILQLIPPERFNKTCYICQEANRIHRSTVGACMQCNKSGCKQQFHVTCAQSLGLLCEEAGNYLDNVKYCGYCRHHYGKLKKGGNVKTIPPYKPLNDDSPSSDSGAEKEPEDSTPAPSSDVLPAPSTSGLAKPPATKSVSGRKSSQGAGPKGGASENPSGNAAVKISPQSKNSTTPKVSTPQAKGTEKTVRKKSPTPNETQRRANSSSSSTSDTSTSNTITTPTVSPVASGNQQQPASGRSKATPLSPSNNKIPPNQQEPIVVINGIRVTSPANTATTTSTVTPQSSQKYNAPSSYAESVITPNDPSFNSAANSSGTSNTSGGGPASNETKQTKKRKAVSQTTPSTYPNSAVATPTTQVNDNPAVMQWESTSQVTDLTPDSSSEDKTKKMRTDGSHIMPAVITKPVAAGNASNSSGGTTTAVEDSATSQPTAYNATSQSQQQQAPATSVSQTPVISSDKHSSRLPSPAPIAQTSGTSAIRNIASTSTSAPSQGQYQNHGPIRPTAEQQSSLVVSVPLPHTSHPKASTSSASMSDAVFVEPATPSTSSWNLRVAYEPNTSQPASMMDQTDDLRRQRPELGLDKPSVIQVDDKSSMPGTSGLRNKKRSPIPSPQMQMPAPMPGTSGTSSYNTSMSRGGVVKRSCAPPPPPPQAPPPPMGVPSTSTQHQQPIAHQDITDSPPNSPGTQRNIKANLDRMGRAPHMLGNELNPESAAAARLSEQLNAELVAHSVFRAPSPVVPPPLINKASSGRQSSSNSSSSQSLDQLLERQWEQGSQFLMEQAQHFDIASLLSCLHQLRTENVRLEEHVNTLVQRRDHLLAVNARLAIPFSAEWTPRDYQTLLQMTNHGDEVETPRDGGIGGSPHGRRQQSSRQTAQYTNMMPPEAVAPPAPPPPGRPHNGTNVRQPRDGMMENRSQQLIREPQTKSS